MSIFPFFLVPFNYRKDRFNLGNVGIFGKVILVCKSDFEEE